MRRRKICAFICILLAAVYSCLTISGYTQSSLSLSTLSKKWFRRPQNPTEPISNETISPPLGKDETPHDINYNIERRFNIDYVHGYYDGIKRKSIPKYIHFIWNNETVPTQFVDNLKSFLTHNPDWQYYFWTFRTGRLLIKKHHPKLLRTFDRYKLDVMRADALRYIIMYHYGGAYFDLDTISLKPLDTVIVGEQCIVTPEPMEHAVFVLRIRSLLSNGVFLCSPQHTFFKLLIERLPSASSYNSLLMATGPLYFTESFKKYIGSSMSQQSDEPKEEIFVISHSVFLDRIKEYIQTTMVEQCPKYTTKWKKLYAALSCDRLDSAQRSSNYMEAVCKEFNYYRIAIEACHKWADRGGSKRTISPRAINDHTYSSTYEHPNSLSFSQHNHIRNIIPNVKMYPDI